MKLSDTKSQAPKIIIYGNFGCGKTCFAMTGGKIVQLIDLDQGLNSAKTLKDNFSAARNEVDILPCYEDIPTRALAFMKARSYLQGISTQCSAGTYPFKILVIDSLTNLHEYCMRMILSNSGLLGQKPRIQDWQMRDIEFLNICLLIKSLPIPVIILAHQQVEEEDAISVISPFLSGKALPNNFFSKFDEMIYLKPTLVAGGLTEYRLINISTSTITAKTRSNFDNNLSTNIGLIKLLNLMGYEIGE